MMEAKRAAAVQRDKRRDDITTCCNRRAEQEEQDIKGRTDGSEEQVLQTDLIIENYLMTSLSSVGVFFLFNMISV